MRKYLFFMILVISYCGIDASAIPGLKPALDPFSEITKTRLPNGLVVILAPSDSATLTNFKLVVEVGYYAEEKSNWGVSHLLEHVLFRNQKLKDDMTYMQLITEAGGSVNGTTQWRSTEYFGSITPQKSTWLLKQFYEMISDPNIIDDYVVTVAKLFDFSSCHS